MYNNKNRVILSLSILISILVGFASYTAITSNYFYNKEAPYWRTQSIGQDFINLYLIIPSILLTAVAGYIKWKNALLIWVGVILYLLYTYLIYCFNIHFNIFFLVYCMILGICFYSLLYFFYKYYNESSEYITKPYFSKITGVYFLIISVGFYFLWLYDIIPAIMNNKIPQTIIDAGLFTNPVHVIDLAVFLPGVFITGILLLKGRKIGFLFAPVILSFFILMDITIIVLSMIMSKGDYSVALVMGILGLISLALLVLNFGIKKEVYYET